MPAEAVSLLIPPEVAAQLPADPGERQMVLELGLREWRVRKALAAFERGEGSLAYAARQAGIPLRELVHLAYARGLEPRVAPEVQGKDHLSLEEAAGF